MSNLQKLYKHLLDNKLINVDFDTFNTYMDNEGYQQKVYNYAFQKNLFSKDFDSFKNIFSPQGSSTIRPDGETTRTTAIERLTEGTPFEWFGKELGDTWYTAPALGFERMKALDSSLQAWSKGSKITDEEVAQFMKDQKAMMNIGQTRTMIERDKDYQKYKEKYGGFAAWFMAAGENPSWLTQASLQSLAQIAGSVYESGPTRKAVVGAAGAALVGGQLGPQVAIPEEIFSVPAAAFAATSVMMETGLTMSQLMREYLEEENKEWNDENVKALFRNENAIKKIRNRAIKRGIAIGIVDYFTGTAAKSMGVSGKLLNKQVARTTRGKVGGSVGLGIGGGLTSEVAGQIAGEQDLNIDEILTEGFTEIGGPQTMLGIASAVTKPASYEIGGTRMDVKQFEDEMRDIDDATFAELYTKGDIKVENDQLAQNLVNAKVKHINADTNLDSKINDSSDRAAAINLEIEIAKLEANKKPSESIKQRIKALKSQLKEITDKYVDNDIDVTIEQRKQAIKEARRRGIKGKITKEAAKARKAGEDITLLSEESFNKLIGENPDAEITIDGVNIDGKKYINIDKATNIAVVSHEILHDSVDGTFASLTTEAQSKLLTDLLDLLGEDNAKVVIDALKADGIQADNNQGVVSQLMDKNLGVEVFTKLSDAIRTNKIEYNESFAGKLKNLIEEILRKLSELGVISENGPLAKLHRKEFGNARQAFNFLRDYSATFDKKGVASKRAKKLAAKFPKTGKTFSKSEISKRAEEIQKKADDIGKKAKNKAEYDAGINVEAYDFYVGKDGKQGALDGLILAKLTREGIDTQADDANVNGVPLANYIEGVKEKMIPEILGFNPEAETTEQGKFGLSGYVNQRLGYRMGDVSKVAKKTVTGRSLDAPIDDSGRTAAELVEGETDSRLEKLEEENLGFLYVNAENRLQQTEEDKNALKSRYRHKLKNNDGSKLIGETQVESVREGVRSILQKLKSDIVSDKFLLNFENMVKKTMKNIVQSAIGTKAMYRQFVLNNFEAIIDFSTVQDLVAMERLVGKGKLKDGKKIFTVPIRRLTTQEDIQKAIDQGKLPPDAINKSAEGVFLSEKRMPTEEELLAFFFGINMQEVLGYELGASTLGTRKDGLSRMIITELAQDATMETVQEPAISEEILSTSPDLTIDIITRDIARKINRSPDLKFSKSLDEIMNDTTQLPDIRKGAEVLVKKGYQSPEWIEFMNNPKVENKIKLELTINYLQRNSENWYLVKKMKGMPARLKKMKGKTHEKFEKIAQQVLADIFRPNYRVGHLTEKNNAPDVRIYSPNNSKFEIGVEVKGTTARGSMKSFNSKKGKGFERDNTTDDFYSDNAKQKVDKLLEKANKQVDKMYEFLGAKREYNSNNNLILTQDQKNKIKEKGLHINKNLVEFITTLDFETMYLNKKGKNGVVRPSHYLQFGVAGMFQMGELNPLNIIGINRFADQNVDIPMTVRFDFSKPLTDGRVRLYVKIEPQLDSRFFKAQNINLFNLENPNLELSYSKSVNLGTAENIVKASDKARLKSYSKTTKGASIFDFDETVGISENFIIAKKEGVTKKIASEEWPLVGEDLANQGYEFDFTDFNRVTKGRPGPLFQKMKNQIKKYGPKNVFILTARAPESQKAIHDWLRSEGINIPLENITGLGNSTGEAKAMWVLDKYANEDYNDMYFVDDALSNVQAVQNVFDQLDIKGKSVQAKMNFSKTDKKTFDSILKRNLGVDKEIDPARAKIIGAKKGSKEFFIAPGADDFQGLMMRLAGQGKQGESDLNFFKRVFFDPFNRAYRKLNSIQYNMMESYSKIRAEHKDVIKKLKKKFDNEFTNEDAIRIYLWDLQDIEVPGLTTKERKIIAAKVAQDADMVEFALKIRKALQIEGDQYLAPTDSWMAGSIKGDMYESLNKIHRDKALQEWQENVNELLDNTEMLAKLEASMGTDYVEALKDMLYRMRTGKNRPTGQNAATNKVLNWLQGSVGAIMFFNVRSAVLQTISTINFINHTDNDLFAFAKAIGNVKQFAEDFKMLFNSPQLKVRRSGLQQDIQTADLADSLSRGGNAANALAYLLKIGFLPTQIADSFAIAFGGAAFYRNRVNSLMKQGMTQDRAESQAMIDFQDITEESQQSSRPDRISKQQASTVGRLLLAFQNTPLQYNRIIKKAVSNIANKRGDIKTHISRIAYYGAIQSLIFYSLQQALFAEDDIEEEQIPGSVKRKYSKGIKDGTIDKYRYPSIEFYYRNVRSKQREENLVNSMADGWLRGSGVKGAMVSTFKNVVRSFMKESEKGFKADYFNTFIEVLNLSPQIGSKARKIKRASDTYKFNEAVMSEIGAFDIDNPVYPMITSLVEGTTNAPVHRIYTKLDNLKEAFNEDNTAMQRLFVALGWNQWQLGIDTYKDVREAKEKIKEEKKAKKKQCRKRLSNGRRCSIMTTNKSQYCYHHD